MKSLTLMEVVQSPGRKPFQQSPESTSCFRAALPFMVRLREVVSRIVAAHSAIDPESLRLLTPIFTARALRRLIYVKLPTDENGAIAKVEQSTANLTSCGLCTSGVTRSSRMRSRCDLSENRACLPPRANVTAWLTG